MIDPKAINKKLANEIKQLSQSMIDELKQIKSYSPQILNVLYCVCVAFGQKTDLTSIKLLLNNKFLLDKFNNFEVSSVTSGMHRMMDRYIHKQEFDPMVLSRHNTAATIICQWLKVLHQLDSEHLVQMADAQKNPKAYMEKLSKCKDFNSQYNKFMKTKGKQKVNPSAVVRPDTRQENNSSMLLSTPIKTNVRNSMMADGS